MIKRIIILFLVLNIIFTPSMGQFREPLQYSSNMNPKLVMDSKEAYIQHWIENIEKQLYDLYVKTAYIEWQQCSGLMDISQYQVSDEQVQLYINRLSPEEQKLLMRFREEYGNVVFGIDFPEYEKTLQTQFEDLKKHTLSFVLDKFQQALVFSKADIKYPLLKRKLKVFYADCLRQFVDNDPRVVEVQEELKSLFFKFSYNKVLEQKLGQQGFKEFVKRHGVEGVSLKDPHIDQILKKEPDRKIREILWNLMNDRGAVTIDKKIELMRIQNQVVRELKSSYNIEYPNYYELVFAVREYNDQIYQDAMDQVEHSLKEEMRNIISKTKQQLGVDKVQPWDIPRYKSDVFEEVRPYYQASGTMPLLEETYNSLGFDISGLHINRETYRGSFPHGGVCIPRDIAKHDICVLANSAGGYASCATSFHETGHAVHYYYNDPDNGHILSENNLIMGETMACFPQMLVTNRKWIKKYLNMPDDLIDEFLEALRERSIAQFRGALHYASMRNFDKFLYQTTDLYDNNPEEYKRLYKDKALKQVFTEEYWNRRAEVMQAPAKSEVKNFYHSYQWAGLIHFNVDTAYMPIAYFLALVAYWHIYHYITENEIGDITGDPNIGKWLIENFYRLANILPWDEIFRNALGENINVKYFLQYLLGQEQTPPDELSANSINEHVVTYTPSAKAVQVHGNIQFSA